MCEREIGDIVDRSRGSRERRVMAGETPKCAKKKETDSTNYS